jgi:hypothetical protein
LGNFYGHVIFRFDPDGPKSKRVRITEEALARWQSDIEANFDWQAQHTLVVPNWRKGMEPVRRIGNAAFTYVRELDKP